MNKSVGKHKIVGSKCIMLGKHRCLILFLRSMKEWIYSVQVSHKQVKNTNNITCNNTLNNVGFPVCSGWWKHTFFFTILKILQIVNQLKCIPLHRFLLSKTITMEVFSLNMLLDIYNLLSLQQEKDTRSQGNYNQIT